MLYLDIGDPSYLDFFPSNETTFDIPDHFNDTCSKSVPGPMSAASSSSWHGAWLPENATPEVRCRRRRRSEVYCGVDRGDKEERGMRFWIFI